METPQSAFTYTGPSNSYLRNRAPKKKNSTDISESIVNQWRGGAGGAGGRRRAGASWVRVRGAGPPAGARRSLPVQHSAAARRPHRSRPGELGEPVAPPVQVHSALT